MITVLGTPRRCCDGLTRRETLKVGALSALGGFLNLPSLLALEANRGAGHRGGKARNVIVLYLLGGAATQDMFDMKPDAPVEVRGEFKPARTSAPGIRICEHLPGMARWMHRAALVRSVNHKAGCHNPLPSFTGYEEPVTDLVNTRDTYPPSMGAVCEYLKDPRSDLPAYAHLPNYLGWGEGMHRPGPYAGFLGKRYDPLIAQCEPKLERDLKTYRRDDAPLWKGAPRLADAVLGPHLTLDRLDRRRSLLGQLDQELRRVEGQPALEAFGRTQQRAFSLLTSTKLKGAFDLSKEERRWQERYGPTLFGSSALVARRLVEAGVRFVNVTWDCYRGIFGFDPDVCWDTHTHNFVFLRKSHLPLLDQVFTTLMEDLAGRGLLEETLVVVMSDFGRTPRVNKDAGRDHWSLCYTVLLAGAGIRGGTVYGESDAQAAYVKDRPVKTGDVCATIYRCLGIDPDMPVYDRSGRPVPVAQGGKAIGEILA